MGEMIKEVCGRQEIELVERNQFFLPKVNEVLKSLRKRRSLGRKVVSF